jgi:hypothetical protein
MYMKYSKVVQSTGFEVRDTLVHISSQQHPATLGKLPISKLQFPQVQQDDNTLSHRDTDLIR